MPFTASGTTITQSGSDAGLAALASIAGVSVISTARATTYNIGSNKLIIAGDCTIKADEKIEIGDSAPSLYLEIASGASLTIYGTNDGNTTTANIANAQIICDKQSPNHWSPADGITVSGTLALQGGMIDIASHINFLASSIFRARAGVIKMTDAGNGYPNLLRFASASGGTIDIEDFVLLQGSNAFELSGINIVALDAYSPRNSREGVMKIASKANPLELQDYNPENCSIDTSYIAGGGFYVIRGMAHKAPTATVHFDHSNASGGGITEVRKRVNISLADGDSGAAITEAAIYASDSVHATSRDYSDAFYTDLVTGEQILKQSTYEVYSDANGAAVIDKLLAFTGVLPGENVGSNSAAREVLYKSKAADHNYIDDFYIWSYGHLPTVIANADLTGLGEAQISWLLFADPDISEARSVVDAYSDIDTPQKLYDRAKSWLVDNYQGETAPLVELAGSTLTSSYSLTINPSATEAFGFDGNTISIRAATFVGDIALSGSGVVNLLGAASIDGAYTDAIADSSATIELPAGKELANCIIRLYATYAEADADTQADGSGALLKLAQGQNSLRYSSSVYGGQTLAIRIFDTMAPNSELIAEEQIAAEPGVYTLTALSFSSDQQLVQIEELCRANATALDLLKAELL